MLRGEGLGEPISVTGVFVKIGMSDEPLEQDQQLLDELFEIANNRQVPIIRIREPLEG